MRVFFDTFLLAYPFDRSRPEKQRTAQELLLAHAGEAVISTQVLIELHAVLTRKLGLARSVALDALRSIDLETVPADAELVMTAAETAAHHQLSIFDAMILEAAVRAKCDELWTEDFSHGSVLRGVAIVNPFAPS